MARRGRAARPDLEVGICGEHGGDPRSIRHCHRWQRLAAAHAALDDGRVPDGTT
jgi:pyruvate,orthophosphate dikinase